MFISGSPNGNQQWPDDSEELFCQQFFAMDTKTHNSSDFFIEIRRNDGHRYSYYSYVKRKDLSGKVNGGNGIRQGAYFAMVLRFKDIYCKGFRNFYALMDIAYKKYIIGNVITESPNGSAYLIETLKSKTAVFQDIENYFANQLGAIINDFVQIDGSFASTQSGSVCSMNLYEKTESSILSKFKSNLKVHLTVDCSDAEIALGSLKTQRDKLEKEFRDLSNKYEDLLKTNSSLSQLLDDVRKQLQERKQTIDKLNEQIKILENQLSSARHLPELEEWILAYAEHKRMIDENAQCASGSRNRHGESGTRRKNIHPNLNIFKYLPWACCAILLIVIVIRSTLSQNDENKITELENKITELTKDNKALSDEKQKLNDKCVEYEKKIEEVRQLSNNVGQPHETVKPWNYLNLKGVEGTSIVKKCTVELKNGAKRWEVIDGKNCVEVNGNEVKITQDGEITMIAYDENGEKIEASKRTLTVKKQ